MRKLITIFSIVILALNINLFTQAQVQAETKQYDNIEVGEYDIIAKALHADSDEASGAAGFINEDAKIKVTEDGIEFTVTIPHNDMAFIEGMQIEEMEPKQDGEEWTFKINKLKPILNSRVQYEVPMLNMEHDVAFRFSLEGLDDLPVKEEPEKEEPEEEKPEPEEPETEEKPEVDEEDGKGPEEEGNEESPEEDQEEAKELDNGFYHLDASYLHASKDEPSSMGSYLSNPVFLSIQDEQVEVTISINDHQTVSKLTIDGKDPTSSKLDGNKRYETFLVDHVDDALEAYVEYQAPYGDSIHYGDARFRIDLDIENVTKTAEEEQPGYGISSEYINLADGLYSISASYINEKNGQNSAMANYLDDKAYISVKEGKAEVFILINDNDTVTTLKVNDQKANDKRVNGNATLKSFDLDSLITELNGYAAYEAPFNGETHYGEATFGIHLNKDTVKKEQELPIENEEPKEEEDTKPKPKPETPKEEDPKQEESDSLKGYSIDYVIKHATEDDASAADNFFEKPGTLLEKDGKKYLQITINSWSMIDWIKVNNKQVSIIKEDKSEDTALIQFEVPADLSEILQLSMKVTVPGLYETEHDARLVMDENSLVEDESDEDYVIHEPSSDDKDESREEPSNKEDEQESIPKDEDNDTSKNELNSVEKPEFGDNGSEKETSNKQEGSSTGANPQTGDNSKLVFYSILLFVSLSLLVVRYRRHRMTA